MSAITSIIIYLQPDATFEGIGFNADNQLMSGPHALEQLATLTSPDCPEILPVILLDSRPLIGLYQVHLPQQLSAKKLIQAIPYALEDQLLTDLAELHFANSPYQAESQSYGVAVMPQALLADTLAQLNTFHIVPNDYLPLALALPYAEQQWTIYCEGELAWVRLGPYQGFSIEATELNRLLELHLAQAVLKPQRCLIITTAHTHLPDLTALVGLAINYQSITSWWELFNPAIRQLPSITMLQGSFKAPHQRLQISPSWRRVIRLSFYCLLVIAISKLGQYLWLGQQQRQLTQQVKQLYVQLFPEAHEVIDPESQVKQALKRLQGSQASATALGLLAKVGSSLRQHPQLKLLSIDYHPHQLQLKLSFEQANDFAAFAKQLQQQGLRISHSTRQAKGKQLISQLNISE